MKIINIKKTIFSVILSFLIVFTTLYFVHAESKVEKLIVHYYRYDGNYTGFNFHLWEKEPGDLGGTDFNFSNDKVGDYGAFHEVDLSENGYSNTTRFGIIVKKGGWEGYREPGGDRFFLLSDMEVKD